MSDWANFIPLILIVLAFWFLVLRPARNRQKDFMATQQALTPGTQVMLASGIYGELVTVGDDTVQIRVAPEVVVTAARQAVSKIIVSDADSAVEERTDEPPADKQGDHG